MTRKTDKRRLASFTTPLFPLGEAFCLLLISPLPPPPQTRPLDFEMLYGVKSSLRTEGREATTGNTSAVRRLRKI